MHQTLRLGWRICQIVRASHQSVVSNVDVPRSWYSPALSSSSFSHVEVTRLTFVDDSNFFTSGLFRKKKTIHIIYQLVNLSRSRLEEYKCVLVAAFE